MKYLIYMPIIVLILACGKDKDPKTDKDAPRMNVKQLLALFEKEAAAFGFDLDLASYPVSYENLPSPTVGRCYYRGRGFNRGLYITLDPSYWAKANKEKREALLFHELGHCVLGQNHRSSSLMAPSIVSDYYEYRDWYLDEMFNHGADAMDQGYGFVDRNGKHSCEGH